MSTPRSPERLLRRAAVLGLLAISGLAMAQDPAVSRRQQLAEQRRQINDEHALRAAECHRRFVVTACLETAQRQRREALERIKREEAALDDAERQQRTIDREHRLAEKQRLAAERPVQPVERVTRSAAAASATAASASHHHAPVPHPVSPSDEAERLQRAAATRQRQAEAAVHRQEVERRNAERAAQHPPAAPLPVPAASSLR